MCLLPAITGEGSNANALVRCGFSEWGRGPIEIHASAGFPGERAGLAPAMTDEVGRGPVERRDADAERRDVDAERRRCV